MYFILYISIVKLRIALRITAFRLLSITSVDPGTSTSTSRASSLTKLLFEFENLLPSDETTIKLKKKNHFFILTDLFIVVNQKLFIISHEKSTIYWLKRILISMTTEWFRTCFLLLLKMSMITRQCQQSVMFQCRNGL